MRNWGCCGQMVALRDGRGIMGVCRGNEAPAWCLWGAQGYWGTPGFVGARRVLGVSQLSGGGHWG